MALVISQELERADMRGDPGSPLDDIVEDYVPSDDEYDEEADLNDALVLAKFVDEEELESGLLDEIHINDDSESSTDDVTIAPWREGTWNAAKRVELERFLVWVVHMQMFGSWDYTEIYQRLKDDQMLMYLQDYPLETWVIPPEQAAQGEKLLHERLRFRNLGIRIYDPQTAATFRPTAPAPVDLPHPYHSQDAIPNFVPAHLYAPPQGYHVAHPSTHHHQPPQQMQLNQGVTTNMHSIRPSTEVVPSHQGRRADREPVKSITPPPLPKTPPYKPRVKKFDDRVFNKSGKERVRKQAECEQFPWNREDVDFEKEKLNATWDDSIYSQETLDSMERVREQNGVTIDRLDKAQAEIDRLKKKGKAGIQPTEIDEGHTNADETSGTKTTRSTSNKGKDVKKAGNDATNNGTRAAVHGDTYHSGSFSFATKQDENRAKAVGFIKIPDLIRAGESGRLSSDICKNIKICWNPGQKGLTHGLELAVFSIRDTVRTRKQLRERKVFTHTAALRIIDFCPDLLWREILIRIASEGGLGNKGIRDRFCRNGSMWDKATVTKRISSALGQKQSTSKSKKDQKESKAKGKGMENIKDESTSTAKVEPEEKKAKSPEEEWYWENHADYDEYVKYFGHRFLLRNIAKDVVPRAVHHRSSTVDSNGDVMMSDAGPSSSRNKGKYSSSNAPDNSDAADPSDADENEEEDGDDGDDDSDAVSLQPSDIFDDSD